MWNTESLGIRLTNLGNGGAFALTVPYGSIDMLDVLGLGVTARQIDDEAALTRMVCGGHHRPMVGDALEIILFPGTSIRDVLGCTRQKRVVLRRTADN